MAGETIAPRRRGRPPIPERRDQVVLAAARLFQRRGYATVSMKDVAASLGLTASALYRHTGSKAELLDAAISSGVDVVEQALRDADGSVEDTLRSLARVAVAREDLWILLRRELRHLPPRRRTAVRRRLADVMGTLRDRLLLERPGTDADAAEFAARAALAAMAVPSQFGHRFDPDALAAALRTVARDVLRLDVDPRRPAAGGSPAAPFEGTPFEGTLSRREELLGIATVLFAERGYAGVSLTDIGAAAGMAGPSLYHHFDSKIDVLVGVLRRAVEWIVLDLQSALDAHTDPLDTLRRLVVDHVDLALTHWELFRVYQNESTQLPPDEHTWITRSHQAFMERWIELARAARPELDETEVRVRVFSALSVVNDMAGSAHLRAVPSFRTRLEQTAFGCIAAVDGVVPGEHRRAVSRRPGRRAGAARA